MDNVIFCHHLVSVVVRLPSGAHYFKILSSAYAVLISNKVSLIPPRGVDFQNCIQ